MNSGEGNTQGEQGELSRLRRLQLEVAQKLRTEYFRRDSATRGNFIWVTLFRYLLDEIREREALLERAYECTWHDDEEYLSKLDTFIEQLKNFSESKLACDEEIKRRKEDIKKDIEDLEKKIEEKGEILEVMSYNLQGLQLEKEDLLSIRETPEFIILSNWVRATCDKCIEMENEITEIKMRIGQKNEDVLEFLGFGHNIFSKVSIEDLKKVPPFKTDEELSISSNMSLQ